MAAVKPKSSPNSADGDRGFARSAGRIGFVIVLLLVAVNFWVARAVAYDGPDIARAWGLAAGLILLFMILAGIGINGRPAGLIIDNRNRVSLSKFQAAAWTVLVVSALAAVAAARIAAGVANPLQIDIPGELLAALGLASASLVASPAVLTFKARNPTPSAPVVRAVAQRLGMESGHIDPAGDIFGRTHPCHAQWLDMFRGEDISNAASPDLSKIQQFLLTLLVIGVYVAALVDMFLRQGPVLILPPAGAHASLPPLSQEFVWLLGISHASYLAYKATPHGPPSGES